MLSSMTDQREPSSRSEKLKAAVQQARPAVCPERAVIWTEYCRGRANHHKAPVIQIGEALSLVLAKKRVAIHPHELIVGNYTSKRVGGSIFPELHGIPMLEDLFRFERRAVNPLQISGADRRRLLSVVPFWATRFLALRVHRSPLRTLRLVWDQLRAERSLINELAGISHVAPDYGRLVSLGTEGIKAAALARQQSVAPGSEAWQFLQAVAIIADGLAHFGERYAVLANQLAQREHDPQRRAELLQIAAACRHVPRYPARTFREGLQSLFFAQIALNLESLDNSVCPGRIDQYLFPLYQRDRDSGRLTRTAARELVAALAIKFCEIIPVFSERATRFHGGLFNGQVITVGGVDSEGQDATNELSVIILEVMDELRMRQPNFHARVHRGSPAAYLEKISGILASGANSPALYCDETIIETLCGQGYALADARNYTGVGCVEPVCQGKSFASTDAALINTPLALELALNQGCRFGSLRRIGAPTVPVEEMREMAQVTAAFETQLTWLVDGVIDDLQAVELANRRHHPTPLTSMLLDGCVESARCSTAGGARYNASGIQCVGASDVGDSLYAIEQAVFSERRFTLSELVGLLQQNLPDPQSLRYLRSLKKFGNDCAEVDRWTCYVLERFVERLDCYRNTRGGPYAMGIYSVTIHQHFGEITGALPNGRRKGQPFASGLAPGNGMDRHGPTALLNSVNRVDFRRVANGVNFNVKFSPQPLRGEAGRRALSALVRTFFKRGGMQMQVNVLDSDTLRLAKAHPEQYPNLLVRVSGYSAYFNDLTPELQDELIARTALQTH